MTLTPYGKVGHASSAKVGRHYNQWVFAVAVEIASWR